VIERFVTRKVIATAQIGLSILFLAMYFYTLHELLHGHIEVKPEWKDVIQTLISVLTGAVMTIIGFWFNRSRPEDPHKPGEPECRPQ